MHLFIPAFVVSLLVTTKTDTEIMIAQTTTESGVTLLSISGQFDDVQKFAEAQQWDPAAIVADGDNATFLTDNADREDLERQMIIMTNTPAGKSFQDAQGTITKSELSELKIEDLTYGHFVAAMNNNVDIIGWTKNYDGKWAQYATQSRIAFYIDADTRTIRNSATGEKTALFIGDEGPRTLLGQISDDDSTFKIITSDFDLSVQVRQDTTPDYLVEVELDGDTINAVSAENLALYFGSKIDDLAWAQTCVDNKIEEVASIGGQNAVFLTFKDTENRYVPATIAIHDGKLAVELSTQYAVKIKDFDDDTVGAPIIRANQKGVVMVDRNGGANVMSFYGAEAYSPAMKNMIDAATNGGLIATV